MPKILPQKNLLGDAAASPPSPARSTALPCNFCQVFSCYRLVAAEPDLPYDTLERVRRPAPQYKDLIIFYTDPLFIRNWSKMKLRKLLHILIENFVKCP